MTIETDRETVRRLFAEAGEWIDNGDAKAANAATTDAVEIADRWHAEGQIVPLLSPLVADGEAEAVRYGAASVLLNRGHADVAVPVLEALDTFMANVVLDQWREQQGA